MTNFTKAINRLYYTTYSYDKSYTRKDAKQDLEVLILAYNSICDAYAHDHKQEPEDVKQGFVNAMARYKKYKEGMD